MPTCVGMRAAVGGGGGSVAGVVVDLLAMGRDPSRVFGRGERADVLGENAMRLLRRKLGVRTGLLVVEMLLVAQALAGRAVEDPVLLPFVELLHALEQEDDARGDDHRHGRELGDDRDDDGAEDDGDLRGLVIALVRLGLGVVPVDLRLEAVPERRQFRGRGLLGLLRRHLVPPGFRKQSSAAELHLRTWPGKPISSAKWAFSRLHPLPLYVTACPGFQGTVWQGFNLLTWGRQSQNFSGSGDEAAQKSARSG